jgi:hypothetical protein
MGTTAAGAPHAAQGEWGPQHWSRKLCAWRRGSHHSSCCGEARVASQPPEGFAWAAHSCSQACFPIQGVLPPAQQILTGFVYSLGEVARGQCERQAAELRAWLGGCVPRAVPRIHMQPHTPIHVWSVLQPGVAPYTCQPLRLTVDGPLHSPYLMLAADLSGARLRRHRQPPASRPSRRPPGGVQIPLGAPFPAMPFFLSFIHGFLRSPARSPRRAAGAASSGASAAVVTSSGGAGGGGRGGGLGLDAGEAPPELLR